ncbi:MAG: hypothetical protein GXO18_07960 [Aquificae bacterium]|nr:hypothetical protein [Aquificota bacterium]
MRQEIRDTINLEYADLDVVFEELKKEEFTGFIKVSIWKVNEYIAFYKGKPERVFISSENGFEEAHPSGYTLPRTGTAQIIETDLFNILNALKGSFNPERDCALCLAGYGYELETCLPANTFNTDRLIDRFERGLHSGYAMFHTHKDVFGIIIFYKGTPIGVFSQGLKGEDALKYINNNYERSMVSLFTLKHDFAKLLSSMGGLKSMREGVIEGQPELLALSDDIKERKMTALLYLDGGRDNRYYSFFLKGNHVTTIRESLLELREIAEGRINFSGKFYLYPLYVEEEPKSIKLDIDTHEDITEKVSEDKVSAIKEAFIDEIGPVGKVLWSKILKEFGWKDHSIPANRLKDLINTLAKEIPFEEHRTGFISKVRRLVK